MAPTLPPEGRLLLYTNEGPVILRHEDDQPIQLQRPGETIWAAGLSPDGSAVLTLEIQEEPTGISREPRILVLDLEPTRRKTIVRVGRGATWGRPCGHRTAQLSRIA
jgi:hypothetical protein